MSIDNAPLQFTWDDVEQWVAAGLLTPDQAEAIRRHVQDTEADWVRHAQGVPDQVGALPTSIEVAVPIVDRPPPGSEQRPGLNLITLAYYFGGFMILLAYTYFIALKWASLGRTEQVAVVAATIGVLWLLGWALRRAGFALAGALLIFAGTVIVPALVYTILRLLGLWPDPSDYASAASPGYDLRMKPVWLTLEAVSLLAAAGTFWRVRFPLLIVLIVFWTWYLAVDLTRWLSDGQFYNTGDQIVSIAFGLILLGLGVRFQRQTPDDYSRWLYLAGHVMVLVNFGPLAYAQGGLVALLFLALYLAFVLGSVWLQRPMFVVFGALGCYAYLSYLAFQVFQGELAFVYALAVIGLGIVLSAVGYQRYARPWLARRLPVAGPPADPA